MSVFEDRASHARGVAITVKNLAAQFGSDTSMATVRQAVGRQGGDDVAVSMELRRKVSAAYQALIAAEDELRELAKAYERAGRL